MTFCKPRGTLDKIAILMETPQFLPTNFLHHRYSYAGLALAVAVLYDVLRWKAEPGFGFVVFVACYIIGFLVLANTTRHIRWPLAHLLLIPIALFTFSVALYSNDFVQYAVPPLVQFLLIIYSLLVTLRPSEHSFGFLHIPAFRGVTLWFRKLNSLVKDLFTFRKQNANVVVLVIAGIIIAVPILFIFTALFRSADPVFDAWFKQIFDFSIDMEWFSQSVWRIIRTVAITGFLGTLFYILLDDEHTLVNRVVRAERYNGIITTVILSLVNILFAVFVFIQIKYLFMSSAAVLEAGKTFAELAREGFFELTWVLVCAGVLLVTIYRSYSYHDHPRVVKLLELLFVIFIAVVAASALKRMYLYQQEYGFTVLRLYVEWFIYGVLALLVVSFASILRNLKFRYFVHMVVVLVIGVGAIVSLINVDRVIAKENIDRFLNENKTLDVHYLSTLSADALPEMKRLFDKTMESCTVTMSEFSNNEIVFNQLDAAVARADSWRSMNMGVIQALALQDIHAQLKQLQASCKKAAWYKTQKVGLQSSHAFECGHQKGDCDKFVSDGRKPVSYEVTVIHYDPPNIRTMTLITKSTRDPFVWYATVLRSDQGGEFLPISEENFRTDVPDSEVYLQGDTVTVFNDKKLEYRTYLVKPHRIYGFWQMTKKQQPVLTDPEVHVYVAPQG